MKRVVLLLCALAFVLQALPSLTAAQTLRVGFHDNPPLVFKDKDGKPGGVSIDVLEHVARKEGWQLEYVYGNFSESLERLQRREIDIQVVVAFSPERAAQLDFTHETLFNNWGVVYSAPDFDFRSLPDLRGHRIAVSDRNAHAEEFERLVREFGIPLEIVKAENLAAVFRMIDDGRVDAGVVGRSFGQMHARDFKVRKTPIIFHPVEIRYAFPKGSGGNIRPALDRHIRELVSDGSSVYHQALARWYDGAPGSVLPPWTIWTALGAAVLLAALVLAMIGFRRQVRAKTAEISAMMTRYREMVELARAVHWELDLATGRFTYVGPQAARMTGYAHEQWTDLDFLFALIHHEDREKAGRECREHMFNGEDHECEVRLITADGGIIWVQAFVHVLNDASGKARKAQGIMFDVTERKRSEAALRDSEFFLRKSQEVARIGSYCFDAKTGTWIASPVLDEIFGIDAEYPKDIDGWLSIVHPLDRAEMRHHLMEHVLRGRNRFEKHYRIIRPSDGEERWLFGHGELEFDDRGEPARMIGTIQDITDGKRVELERGTLEAQLRQAQKMEAVGQLAAGIAHDFNNILNALMGYAEFIRSNINPDGHRGYAERMVGLCGKGADLTRSLLTLGRRQAGTREPVKLNDVVLSLKEVLERLIRENVTLDIILCDQDPVVLADRGLTEQVFMNLATNARDAMPRGGNLIFSTEVVDADATFSGLHGLPRPGKYGVVSVRDTGTGMDEETRQRIFEPFFTTKEVGKGTGLGLAMVYGIVKQHGGAVSVYSEPGQGTMFRIYLPCTTDEVADRQTEEAGVPKGSGGKTILVAEDSVDVRDTLVTLLSESGYRVISAADGREALARFGEHRQAIDLIVSDIIMPNMDGGKLFEEVRGIDGSARFIFLSGYASDIMERYSIPAGDVEFVSKPVMPKDLLEKIRSVLEQKEH